MSTEGFITSHGPNECTGPPCCREIEAGCPGSGSGEEPCIDFCCCCDACLHDFIAPEGVPGAAEGGGDPCQGHCCKCVPKAIIARFTPDTPSDYCRERAYIMWAEHELTRTTYSAGITGAGDVVVSIDKTYEQECAWIVEAEDIYHSEEILINHSDVKCSRLPELTPIEVTAGTFCEIDCTGTITFELYEPEKIPFRRPDYSEQDETIEHECGECTEICWAICVRRQLAGDGSGSEEEIERHTFFWDEYDLVWRGGKSLSGGSGSGECGEEEIGLVEVDGVCFLKILAFDIETFEDDLIALNKCALGLDVEAEDEDGNWIAISCNQCTCWDYLCGKCRCTCPEVCIVGGDENTAFGPKSLSWDETAEAWVDETETPIVTIARESECKGAGCEATIDGFDDPVSIPEKCGSEISIVAVEGDDTEDDFANFKWRHVWCSRGNPCTSGGCDNCSQIPSVVFADVAPSGWDSVQACNEDACFSPFTVPMSVVRNPPGSASEFSWIGYYVFDCFECLSSTPVKTLLQITLDCDGTVRFTLFDDQGSILSQQTDSIAIPCSSCDDPLEETVIFDGTVSGAGCCDNNEQFNITFTE